MILHSDSDKILEISFNHHKQIKPKKGGAFQLDLKTIASFGHFIKRIEVHL